MERISSPIAKKILSAGRFIALLFLSPMIAKGAKAYRPAALVTGSTDGIGVTTAKHLVSHKGFDVILHGRDPRRIQRAEELVMDFVAHQARAPDDFRIIRTSPADLSTVDGALQLAQEVRSLCERENLPLTVLMNNAGVFSEKHVITSEGLELTFAVNVVSVFVITSLLLPVLLKQKGSRIVIASSISQCQSIRNWDDFTYSKRRYSAHAAYSESKLLDAMLTMEIAERLKQANVGTDQLTCNCLDPGTVNTKMLLAGWGPCGIAVEDALDQTWLCSSDEVKDTTGKYFVYRSERRAASSAYDPHEREKLWNMLSELAPKAAEVWNFEWMQA